MLAPGAAGRAAVSRRAGAGAYNPAVPRPPAPPQVLLTRALPACPPPLELLRRLGRRPGAFLRLVAGPGFRGPAWSIFALTSGRPLAPRRWPHGRRLADFLAPLAPRRVRHLGPRVPFGAGWVGYLGYEARSGVEVTPKPRVAPLGFPVLWLARAPASIAFDHAHGRVYLSGLGDDRAAAARAAGRLWSAVSRARPRTSNTAPRREPSARVSAADYRARVSRVRRHVRAGDIFQANLSQRFDADGVGDPVALFERLVASQPAPYMTFLSLPAGRALLSASPERFLKVEGRQVATDPMKGTRPRGASPAQDRALAAELESSEKDRAELAMIVDLSRNDLARVCRAGSVRVRVPRRLIAFARVHQAIAVVEGRLRAGRTRLDLLEAAFPPGSVTGAPKVRAMEVIDALEGEGRGPYCGTLGWFDVGGDMDLAVAIRTLLVARRQASYRVGGGITLRSDPAAEWRETLAKGRGLFAALAGHEAAGRRGR